MKAYIKNDFLKNKEMNKQKKVEVFAERIIIAVGNFSFSVRDEGNAIIKRLKIM